MKHELSRIEMEARRLRAVTYLKEGLQQASVARVVGVSRTSVSRWTRQLQHGQSMSGRKAPGRPPRLNANQQVELEDLFRRTPGKWTCQHTADLIFERFGIRFHRDHAGRILVRLKDRVQKLKTAGGAS